MVPFPFTLYLLIRVTASSVWTSSSMLTQPWAHIFIAMLVNTSNDDFGCWCILPWSWFLAPLVLVHINSMSSMSMLRRISVMLHWPYIARLRSILCPWTCLSIYGFQCIVYRLSLVIICVLQASQRHPLAWINRLSSYKYALCISCPSLIPMLIFYVCFCLCCYATVNAQCMV